MLDFVLSKKPAYSVINLVQWHSAEDIRDYYSKSIFIFCIHWKCK